MALPDWAKGEGRGVSVERDIDDGWIEKAIDRYQQVERRLADFDQALSTVEVSVRSPDGLVEVTVTADGVIRDVVLAEAAGGRPARELSRSVSQAVSAATDAAQWARRRLHQDMFGDYPSLPRLGPATR